MVVLVVQRVDRYSYFCVYPVLLVPGSAQSRSYLMTDAIVRFDNPMGRVLGFSNQILSRRIWQYRTAYEDRSIYQIEK